jgi:hypothetical protein
MRSASPARRSRRHRRGSAGGPAEESRWPGRARPRHPKECVFLKRQALLHRVADRPLRPWRARAAGGGYPSPLRARLACGRHSAPGTRSRLDPRTRAERQAGSGRNTTSWRKSHAVVLLGNSYLAQKAAAHRFLGAKAAPFRDPLDRQTAFREQLPSCLHPHPLDGPRRPRRCVHTATTGHDQGVDGCAGRRQGIGKKAQTRR